MQVGKESSVHINNQPAEDAATDRQHTTQTREHTPSTPSQHTQTSLRQREPYLTQAKSERAFSKHRSDADDAFGSRKSTKNYKPSGPSRGVCRMTSWRPPHHNNLIPIPERRQLSKPPPAPSPKSLQDHALRPGRKGIPASLGAALSPPRPFPPLCLPLRFGPPPPPSPCLVASQTRAILMEDLQWDDTLANDPEEAT